MKKRILAVSMAVMMAASLAACGGSSAPATTAAPATAAAPAETKAAETKAAETKAPETEAKAADYPTSDIQMVVPVGAGGDTDTNARLLAKHVEGILDVAVPVVNVKGGSGTIGMEQVRTSDPDGYNALFFHTEALLPKIAGLYDYSLDDFKVAGTCLIANTTLLVTHPESGFATLQEFIDKAKAAPGEVEFGMATGGYPHLIGLALEKEADIDLNLVDIGGNADKIAALAGHQTDIINVEYALVKDYITTGEFIPLALLTEERNPLFDDIPTAKEQGLDMKFGKFFFVAFPKDTPDDVVGIFSNAMKEAVADPEFVKAAQDSYALTPTYMDPAEATAYAKSVEESLLKYQELFKNAQ